MRNAGRPPSAAGRLSRERRSKNAQPVRAEHLAHVLLVPPACEELLRHVWKVARAREAGHDGLHVDALELKKAIVLRIDGVEVLPEEVRSEADVVHARDLGGMLDVVDDAL